MGRPGGGLGPLEAVQVGYFAAAIIYFVATLEFDDSAVAGAVSVFLQCVAVVLAGNGSSEGPWQPSLGRGHEEARPIERIKS